MNWQALYDSPWSHPGVAWLFMLPLAVFLLFRFPPAGALRTVLLLITAETALDAWLTGALSPVPAAHAQVVGIAFVILGDLRFFVLAEYFRRSDATWPSALPRALGLSLIIPILQGAAVRLSPDAFTESRRVYLAYELLFAILGVALLLARYPWRRTASVSQGRYVGRLLALVVLQYVLWASCDLLILSGQAWALGLRLVPNAMYYGLFPVLAALLAPREART